MTKGFHLLSAAVGATVLLALVAWALVPFYWSRSQRQGFFLCLVAATLIGYALGGVGARREPTRASGPSSSGGVRPGRVLNGVGLVSILLIGVVGVLDRRPSRAYHSVAVGHVQEMLTAQHHFETATGVYAGDRRCLRVPADCVLEEVAGELVPRPIDLPFRGTRHRYALSFHPGAPAASAALKPGVSGVATYAYVAVPEPDLRIQGYKALCGDSSGRICGAEYMAMPRIRDGQCVFNEDHHIPRPRFLDLLGRRLGLLQPPEDASCVVLQ